MSKDTAPNPTVGGSFIRDPKSGALTQTEGTKPPAPGPGRPADQAPITEQKDANA